MDEDNEKREQTSWKAKEKTQIYVQRDGDRRFGEHFSSKILVWIDWIYLSEATEHASRFFLTYPTMESPADFDQLSQEALHSTPPSGILHQSTSFNTR